MKDKIIKYMTEEITLNEPSDDKEIRKAEQELGIELPNDYVEFLRITNGLSGFIGENNIDLWPIEELVEMNSDYGVNEFIPGIVLLGSNRAGEAFGIDTRTTPYRYIMIPFIFDYESIIYQGDNLLELFERLKNDSIFEQ